MASYKIILTKVNRETDLKSTIVSVERLCHINRQQAIDGVKNLPLTLLTGTSPENAARLQEYFAELGAEVTCDPPLPTPYTPRSGDGEFKRDTESNSTTHQGYKYSYFFLSILAIVMILSMAGTYYWFAQRLPQSAAAKEETIKKQAGSPQSQSAVTSAIGLINQVRQDLNQNNWKDWGGQGAIPAAGSDLLPDPRLQEALDTLNKALEREPNNAELYRWRGYLWSQKGMYANARADFKQAVTLVPANIMYRNLLAQALIEEENFEHADYVLRQSLSMNHTHLPTLRNLSILHLYYMRDSLNALQYLQTYFQYQKNPTFEDRSLRTDMTHIIWQKLNRDYSEEVFRPRYSFSDYEQRRKQIQAQLKQKEQAHLHEELALLYLQKGMYEPAEQELLYALRDDPERLSSNQLLSIVLARRGEFFGALNALKRGLERNPREPFFLRNAALIEHYFTGKLKDAYKLYIRYLNSPDDKKNQVYQYAQECQMWLKQ